MAARNAVAGLLSTTKISCSCLHSYCFRGKILTKLPSAKLHLMTQNYNQRIIPKSFNLLPTIAGKSFASKSRKQRVTAPVSDHLKPDLKLGPDVMYHELPIVFINATYNNTMFTITDHNGRTVGWTSAGAEGFKGAKRGTNHAGQMAGIAASKKAIEFGINRARVKIKGIGPGRQTSVKGLMAGGIEIVSITDVTPMPHNGCRPPKQRRI